MFQMILDKRWSRMAATAALTLGLCMQASAAAVLSGNLLAGPASDFEDTSGIKLEDSPLTEGEVTPVRAWQFHPDFDLGRWISNFGASAVDSPQDTWNDGGDVAPINRSVDPLNPGNHVLESASFRPTAGLILAAPENHVAGTASIDFDYYWNNWTGLEPGAGGTDGASIFKMWIYGFNQEDLPTWGDRYGPDNNGPANGDGTYDGFLWTNPNWSEWGWGPVDAPGHDELAIESLGNQWNTLSVTDPSRTSFEITTPYDYYYISLYLVTYSEPHQYFWLYGGRVIDQMAVALDNIDFRLPVEQAHLPGDFDGSGTVDTQDINPFILALTNPGQYQTQYGVDPVVYDTNNDDVINTEDINPFIIILTGGGQSAIIPEPASFALLAMGGLALMRRR